MSKCCLPEETSSIHNIVFRVLSRNEIASTRSMGGLKQVGDGKWVHPVTTVFLQCKERGMQWWCWISRENYQDGEMVWELTGKKASLLGAVVSGNPNPLQNLPRTGADSSIRVLEVLWSVELASEVCFLLHTPPSWCMLWICLSFKIGKKVKWKTWSRWKMFFKSCCCKPLESKVLYNK